MAENQGRISSLEIVLGFKTGTCRALTIDSILHIRIDYHEGGVAGHQRQCQHERIGEQRQS